MNAGICKHIFLHTALLSAFQLFSWSRSTYRFAERKRSSRKSLQCLIPRWLCPFSSCNFSWSSVCDRKEEYNASYVSTLCRLSNNIVTEFREFAAVQRTAQIPEAVLSNDRSSTPKSECLHWAKRLNVTSSNFIRSVLTFIFTVSVLYTAFSSQLPFICAHCCYPSLFCLLCAGVFVESLGGCIFVAFEPSCLIFLLTNKRLYHCNHNYRKMSVQIRNKTCEWYYCNWRYTGNI